MSAPSDTREIEWERSPLVEPKRDAEVERWARQAGALKAYPLHYYSACPWLARSMARLGTIDLTHLDHDLAGRAVLVVSRDNSCRYCLAAARLLLRAVGRSEESIESLEGDLASAEQAPERHPDLTFVRRLSRSNPPPTPADIGALREAGFSREEILELAFVTAQYVAINRINTMVALPPERFERLDRGWLLPLLRPAARRMFKARRRRHPPVFLSAGEKTGPFAAEVTGLDGLPAGRTLRQILDDAWSSPILTRRTKALAFAVVARGLGADRVEREALELLAADGFERSAAESALAHLASPALDPVESALLPFVPETLWYEPAPLQRQVRQLRGKLSDAELLEAVGIAAFANAVCRLSLALEAIE
ncbi:MAG: hypothetical protein JRH16_08805 [Deltaproteobacteria bacterium]|nr:hypothetical protein [Deltaproteobacteria bacterium]MBW2363240.1 hypothetical protein [Deltaproteobacteria bacterium]